MSQSCSEQEKFIVNAINGSLEDKIKRPLHCTSAKEILKETRTPTQTNSFGKQNILSNEVVKEIKVQTSTYKLQEEQKQDGKRQRYQPQSRHQHRSTDSSPSIPSKTFIRKGKWSREEEAFAEQLIKEFTAGTVDCKNGTTLRSFLAKRLNCTGMRISKKFAGKNKGNLIFIGRSNLGNIGSDSEALRRLEHEYIQSVLREHHASVLAIHHLNAQTTHPQESHIQTMVMQHAMQCAVAAQVNKNSFSPHNLQLPAPFLSTISGSMRSIPTVTKNIEHNREKGKMFKPTVQPFLSPIFPQEVNNSISSKSTMCQRSRNPLLPSLLSSSKNLQPHDHSTAIRECITNNALLCSNNSRPASINGLTSNNKETDDHQYNDQHYVKISNNIKDLQSPQNQSLTLKGIARDVNNCSFSLPMNNNVGNQFCQGSSSETKTSKNCSKSFTNKCLSESTITADSYALFAREGAKQVSQHSAYNTQVINMTSTNYNRPISSSKSKHFDSSEISVQTRKRSERESPTTAQSYRVHAALISASERSSNFSESINGSDGVPSCDDHNI